MIDFPASPTVGQTFTAAGVTWTYDGAKWTLGPSAPNLITVSDTPPPNPSQGALWWESVNGQMYVFYNDGSSSQWVPTTNQMGGGYATTAYVDAARLGDNRVINGDMRIDQRNNGASGTALAAYMVDRWQYNSAVASKGTWQRGAAGPLLLAQGFGYYLIFTSSSAYASATGDQFDFCQQVEADMVGDFAWGTPNAQAITLSFWAQSSLAGMFGGSIRNYPTPSTRSYPFTYSIPVANTWTKIAITIPGDTAGTWVLQGNAAAFSLMFDLGSGATFRGPANAWASGNYTGATGAVSVVGTNGAQFYLTGVKLEIGSVATPFNRQSLAKSMADCQRYYEKTSFNNAGSAGTSGSGLAYFQQFSTVKRAAPTVVAIGTPTATNVTGQTFNSISISGFSPYAVSAAAGGYAWVGTYAADAEL